METTAVVLGPDQKVAKVEFVDGTIFERLGPQHWIANSDHPRFNEWLGDIIVDQSGGLKFQYKYAKTLSQCNLEIRFQDGSRIALKTPDGAYVYPSTLNYPSIRTLEETAVSSISALGVYIYDAAKRLRLTGVVSSEGMLNINYLLLLNSMEEQPLMDAVRTSGQSKSDLAGQFEIVQANFAVSYSLPPMTGRNASEEPQRSHSFHSEASYYYDQPRPDHTATTVIFFIDENTNRLKVVTGIRGGEPYKGREALPGGFVDVHENVIENVYDAAAREVKEETGGQVQKLQLLRVSDARKDPRNQVIDSQFIAQMNQRDFEQLKAGDDIADLHARDVAELLAEPEKLAFDHGEALGYALAACRTRPELRAAAYFTARDTEYNKAVLKQYSRSRSAHLPPEKARELEALGTLLIDVLGYLKKLSSTKIDDLKEKIETEIKRLRPSISSADLDYTRAKAMQIQYEEIDYGLSKGGWTAAAGSDGSISGSFMRGAVIIDSEQTKAFGPTKMLMDDPISVPGDVGQAMSIALKHEEISAVDRETIMHLEKVLKTDLEQRALLENGYQKSIGSAKFTKPSAIIAFLLSYCGRKPEDISNQTSSGR